MNECSRTPGFPANDSGSRAACIELNKNDVLYGAAGKETASQSNQFVYIYAPLEDADRLNHVLNRSGIAHRLNEYRACEWSKGDTLCYFRYESLNSFQKILLQDAKTQRATVISLTQYFEENFGIIEVDLLGPEQLLEIDAKPAELSGRKWSLRTGVEWLFALLAILFLLPFGCLVGLLIKLDSKGPVFFRQLRTGLYNREFEIVKFRSMFVDAEQHGARWAVQDDDRITRVGHFLRKARIDELPQLINVIRGEMSLIGPRPEREVFIRQLESQIPFYRFRHLVKPGITGLAQVMYGYGASIEDARQKHRYDLYYIKYQGWWMDLKIIWKTLRIVMTGKGV